MDLNPARPIACRICGAPFVAGDLDVDRAMANCRFCHAVSALTVPSRPAPRPPAPLPTRFACVEADDGVRVSWRWFTPGTLTLALFCVAWDSSLFVWYQHAWVNGPIWSLLFPLGHVAAGIAITYRALTGLFNRSVVELESSVLSVRHGPIPSLKRNLVLAGNDLKQLYVKERLSGSGDDRTRSYDLCAITCDGRELVVLPKLDEANQALYLEQLIETRLRIFDQAVTGELPRGAAGSDS